MDVGPNAVRQERGWKLFLLLPRLLLHRLPRGGNVHKSKLAQRIEDFARGRWLDLLVKSQNAIRMLPQHTVARRGHKIRYVDDTQRRVARALALVQVGELSAGRSSCSSTEETLRELCHPARWLRHVRDPQRRCGRTVR